MELNSFLLVLVGIFANFRIAELFTIDQGPYRVFERLGEFAGRKAAKSNFWYQIAEILNCAYCFGIWSALFIALFISIWQKMNLFHFLIVWFAIAGGQSFLQSIVKRNNGEEE